jgi:hypothetical protein
MTGPTGQLALIPYKDHSGAFVEDLDGNFHLVVSLHGVLKHYWRDNAVNGFPWKAGPAIPVPQTGGLLVAPTDVDLAQQTRPPQVQIPQRLRLIARFGPRLFQYIFDFALQTWSVAIEVTIGGHDPLGATGHPALAPTASLGYLLLVPSGNKLIGGLTGLLPGSWDAIPPLVLGGGHLPWFQTQPIDVALIYSRYDQFDVVVRVRPFRESDTLQHFFWKDAGAASVWFGPREMVPDDQPITGVTGRPAFVQGLRDGNFGNFEVLVPQDNQIIHYWRDNNTPNDRWHRRGPLPSIAGVVPGLRPVPKCVALLQSSGDGGNLEVVASFRGRGEEFLASYYFDNALDHWHGPFDISVDGTPISAPSIDF